MNKKALSILLTVSILMLSSCSEQVRHTGIDDDLEPSELTEDTTPETSQATSETAENTGENWPADRYIPFVSGHGGDGPVSGGKGDLMDDKELALDLNELNLDELEAVNGGSLLADSILNNEAVRNFIRNNKIAGVALEQCITRVCDYLRSYLDKYITKQQIIDLVSAIYDAF